MISFSFQALKTVLLRMQKERKEITLQSISEELTCNISLTRLAEVIHSNNLQSYVTNFYGSTYITSQSEYVYNFLKSINPKLKIIHNKEISKLTYLQLYIPEKDTCILIDYDLMPGMTKSKIIRINRTDFSNIFLLAKTKLLLINSLDLEKRLILDKNEIDILEYIDKHKNLSEKQLYSKLYTKLLNKMIQRTDVTLKLEKQSLFTTGVSDFKYIKVKEEIINTKKHLQNITSFYDDIKEG